MTTVDIILIIGIAILLIALIIVILMLRKNGTNNNGDYSKVSESFNKSIGEMNSKIDSLNSNMKTNIDLAVSTKMGDLLKNQNEQNEKELGKLKDLELNLTKELQEKFTEISKTVNGGIVDGFTKNNDTIQKVNDSLGRLDEAKKNLDALQEQVTSLNSVLSNNKSFGRFGELSLENLLHDVFGDTEGCYYFQYALKDKDQDVNTRPDAVVMMPDPIKILCIDSKFNFLQYKDLFDNENTENDKGAKASFRDALKAEITKISNDYIVKGKTAEYAILYVPSDGIYSYIQGDDELYTQVIAYARQKKVVLASPSTLQPILANLNILKFNINTRKNIDKIIHELDMLRKEYGNFTESWGKFNEEVNKLSQKTTDFDKNVSKIGTRLERINSIAPDTLPQIEDKKDQ